jgi:hypothetical protein
MTDQWYYGWDDQILGPFSAQQLRDLAEAGHIQPMDTIWKEGVQDGVPAYRVKNLFAPPPVEEVFAPSSDVAQSPRPPAEQAEPPRGVPETEIVINLEA